MTQEGLREAVAPGPHLGSRAPDEPLDAQHRAKLDRLRRDHFLRSRLEDARVFRRQGRLDPAERVLHQILAIEPEHVRARRLLAVVLDETGRAGSAALQRVRADELDPPSAPLPDEPLEVPSEWVLVALLDPDEEALDRAPERARAGSRQLVGILSERLRVRLPHARVERTPPDTVPAIRDWLGSLGATAVLSIRAERAFCAETTKDGAFSLARLRVVAAAPGAAPAPVHRVHKLIEDPTDADGCVDAALARALEQALAIPGVVRALAGPAEPTPWSRAQIRALFPHLGVLIAAEIERGLALLSTGRIAEAAVSFQRAAEIDPGDPDARAYLAEAENTLAMMRELPRVGMVSPGVDLAEGTLDAQLPPAQRRALERRLSEEKQRRDELLARLTISESESHVPPRAALAALHPVRLPAADAAGPRLARERSAAPIEARALFASDGQILARFYFAAGEDLPLLREEDRTGDTRPDRWVLYAEGVRREMWEDIDGTGQPALRWVFRPDGAAIDRVEIRRDLDGGAERVLHYTDGRLFAEERDTNGDGRMDRLETFDADGHVELREEDLDGDGRFDVRSRFHGGKLVTREISDPRHLERALDPASAPASRVSTPSLSSSRWPN